ncbi:MAG: hypothetical protein QM695_06825 [Micropruina sp.]
MKGKAEIIEGPGPVPPRPEFLLNDQSVELHDGKLSTVILTPGKPEDVTLLARNSTSSWYWIYIKDAHNWGYVYHFDAHGTVVGTYTLPRPGTVVPTRPLVVSDDEKLYQMNITNQSVKIMRLSPNH